ncbi:hypothetical protein CHUAL_001055 [Chamberlinius hualienensis]
MKSLTIVIVLIALLGSLINCKPVGNPTCVCSSEGEKLSDDSDCHTYYICDAKLNPVPQQCPTGTCYFHNQGICTVADALCLCN